MDLGHGVVLVVGSLNVDTVVRMERCPAGGETVVGEGVARFRGGKGANQAWAAARTGARVRMAGAVGDDEAGAWMCEGLAAGGVDVGGVVRRDGAETGSAQIWVDGTGENRIVVVAGANGTVSAEDIGALDFSDVGVVLLQLEVPLDAVETAARRGREAGAVVVLDPAPAPAGGLPDSLLAQVDYLTPNVGELAALGGSVEDLLARGVRNVVVTRGGDGATLAGEAGSFVWEAPEVAVLDTTGAGDAWNGALGAGLMRGASVFVAGSAACVYASEVVGRRGAWGMTE